MLTYRFSAWTAVFDPEARAVVSLKAGEKELVGSPAPLFAVQLRASDGSAVRFDVSEAGSVECTPDAVLIDY